MCPAAHPRASLSLLSLQRQSALVRKSFIAQFINTAIIAIAVSARLPESSGIDNPLKVREEWGGEHHHTTPTLMAQPSTLRWRARV
jgi:hypothetical protein